jgi:hypothetical protein
LNTFILVLLAKLYKIDLGKLCFKEVW